MSYPPYRGFSVNNFGLNVPLFDGTVYIRMQRHDNRGWYNNRRNRNYGQYREYDNRSITPYNSNNRNMRHFTPKRERASSYAPSSHQVVNPFAVGSVENLNEIAVGSVENLNEMTARISELKTIQPMVIVHGGAGKIPDNNVNPKIVGVKNAATVGYRTLKTTGSVLGAVEAAVVEMENDPAFNAGYGSVLNLDGEVEMEASIQRGSDLAAGGVTLIKDFPNPISIARKVLEETPHSLLGGDGAKKFALQQGFTTVNPSSLITDSARNALKRVLEVGGDGGSELAKPEGVGTVGAVAIDSDGHIAVATSTGGRTGKYVGRIGDTPQIGSGTYADDYLGGVSTTGHGEAILRTCLAHEIIKRIEAGATAQNATEGALESMTKRTDKTAGAITISRCGDIGVYFTAERMAWCYVKGNKLFYGVDREQCNEEEYQEKDNKEKVIES